MTPQELTQKSQDLADQLRAIANEVQQQSSDALIMASQLREDVGGTSALVIGLTVFVLAVFVGYHVVWRVTPALHSPLMAVTNAISSVIIVGALIAAGPADLGFSEVMGFIAVTLASVNIFGGFIVTHRMLSMFKKKQR